MSPYHPVSLYPEYFAGRAFEHHREKHRKIVSNFSQYQKNPPLQ